MLITSDGGQKFSLGGTQKPDMKLPLRTGRMHAKALTDSSRISYPQEDFEDEGD